MSVPNRESVAEALDWFVASAKSDAPPVDFAELVEATETLALGARAWLDQGDALVIDRQDVEAAKMAWSRMERFLDRKPSNLDPDEMTAWSLLRHFFTRALSDRSDTPGDTQ